MEFQNTAYLPSPELNFQYPASYQYPEAATPTDLWMEMEFNQYTWNSCPPTDPRIGPAAPYLAETPQTSQLLQTSIPYIFPEFLPWSYQNWQQVSPLESKR